MRPSFRRAALLQVGIFKSGDLRSPCDQDRRALMAAPAIGTAAIYGFYSQLVTRYDAEMRAIWFFMDPKPRPCFTQTLLADLAKFQRTVEQTNRNSFIQNQSFPARYAVLASK